MDAIAGQLKDALGSSKARSAAIPMLTALFSQPYLSYTPLVLPLVKGTRCSWGLLVHAWPFTRDIWCAGSVLASCKTSGDDKKLVRMVHYFLRQLAPVSSADDRMVRMASA